MQHPWDSRTSVAGDRRAAKGADVCSRNEARGPEIGIPPVLEYEHCSTLPRDSIGQFYSILLCVVFTNILFQSSIFTMFFTFSFLLRLLLLFMLHV